MRRRRAVPGDPTVEIVDVALARGPTRQECDGAEYLLVRTQPQVSSRRIAVDCDVQTGADERAHADTKVEGGDLVIGYEEGHGGDRCQGVDARFHLSPFHLVKEGRYDGSHQQNRCQRENEIAIDWDASDHLARWTPAACSAKPNALAKPAEGAAIPKVVIDGANAVAAVGSCGALIDATRAARWMKPGAIASGVRLRAVVVNDRLLIDVDGMATGSLSIIAASAALGDGDNGGMGCAPDVERSLSVTRIRLENGQTETKGSQAPILKVSAREGTTVHLATESIASLGRVALSYESPTHQRLDSSLLHSPPAARDLPPLDGSSKTGRCQLEAGRVDVRADNTGTDPALELR